VPSTQTATCTGGQNRLGYPIPADVTDYGRRDGDVFVSGTLRGRLTIAAENNIIVANTTYQTTGAASTDMLELVANQFIQVYHPVNDGGQNLTDNRNPTHTFTNPQIHAAMLALGHSFVVQNTATTTGSSTPRRRTSRTSPGPLPGQPVGRDPEPVRPAGLRSRFR
jgi:hypothetical protein